MVDSLDALLAMNVDVVAECASQEAVRSFGASVLKAGSDLVVASSGALADSDLLNELEEAAIGGNASVRLPSGAVGAVDALSAGTLSGMHYVRYRARKLPEAWRGTPAEDDVTLSKLDSPTVVFSGTARNATLNFPKNANVAATVALAGLGFEDTAVELVADPHSDGNIHGIEAEGEFGELRFTIRGEHLPGNPTTSALAAWSTTLGLKNLASPVKLG